MKIFCVILFALSAFVNTKGDIYISEDDYALLPPIFTIEPYEECLEQNKLFCRVFLKLEPLNKTRPSHVWKLIEETKKSKRHYNHEELFHAICIHNTNFRSNDTALNRMISNVYASKCKSKGLKVTVHDSNCENNILPRSTIDGFGIGVLAFYVLVIFLATCYHLYRKSDSGTNKYILLFSSYYNFKKLVKLYQQDNPGKLKCVQGIRFYTSVLIICCHTFCSYAIAYTADTKYFEDIPLNFIRHSLRNLFVFLVQNFFLLSAWFLSYQTFTTFKNNKSINIVKYVFVTFLNRYLRIIPHVFAVVVVFTNGYIYGLFSGPVKNMFSDKEYERCRKTWWINLLFINNHYQEYDMCYSSTWYLSADTQLYLISLLFLGVVLTLTKKYKMMVMLAGFTFAMTVPSVISYLNNLDMIYRLTPEHLKEFNYHPFELIAIYMSTYANMATYMLGLIFGYIYFRLENKRLYTSNISRIFWWILTIGLPLVAIVISNYEFSRITTAVLAGTLRPMYALGVGIGILGMSQNIGGFLKTLCECKMITFLGNFAYSIYIINYGIIFIRAPLAFTPIPVSDFILLTSFLKDTILSVICGILLHLFVEMPASELQNIFMYKFSTKTISIKKDQ